MIGSIKGILLEKESSLILLEANGIGYEINIPKNLFYSLPQIGQEIILFIYFLFRKDTQMLFGFYKKQEKILFCDIITVAGIGPKLALSIISEISFSEFILAIKYNKINILTQLSGVGKKLAERLIVEMKNNIKNVKNKLYYSNEYYETSINIFNIQKTLNNSENEAISALIRLGYKSQEAHYMIKKVVKNNNTDSETLIREALNAIIA